jgi:hypothetical protein
MALSALIAAQNKGFTHANLTTAITNAKNYLTSAQNSDGGFPYSPGETSNTATTAWADMALHAAGVTGTPDTKAKEYMRGNQEENGSFRWQSGSEGETFTTSYAVIALAGSKLPVKVMNVSTPTPTPTNTPTPTPTNTLTPTNTPTPTSTPTPTPTLTPTNTPTPIPPSGGTRPNIQEIVARIREQQRGLMESIREQQRLLIERIRKQIEDSIKKPQIVSLIMDYRSPLISWFR